MNNCLVHSTWRKKKPYDEVPVLQKSQSKTETNDSRLIRRITGYGAAHSE